MKLTLYQIRKTTGTFCSPHFSWCRLLAYAAREEIRPEEVQMPQTPSDCVMHDVYRLSKQHRHELRQKEWANAHLMADSHKALAELTSVKEINAEMCVWIDTATRQMEVVRHTFRVGNMGNGRPLRTKEDFVGRMNQLRESEVQLFFLRDELARRDGEGETATVIRHIEELGSLHLELEQAKDTNGEVEQLRKDSQEHEARVRMAASGATSYLHDEVSRLNRVNVRIRDNLASAKAQVAECTISRDYFRVLAEEQHEKEGAEVRILQAFDGRGEKKRGAWVVGRGGIFDMFSLLPNKRKSYKTCHKKNADVRIFCGIWTIRRTQCFNHVCVCVV